MTAFIPVFQQEKTNKELNRLYYSQGRHRPGHQIQGQPHGHRGSDPRGAGQLPSGHKDDQRRAICRSMSQKKTKDVKTCRNMIQNKTKDAKTCRNMSFKKTKDVQICRNMSLNKTKDVNTCCNMSQQTGL